MFGVFLYLPCFKLKGDKLSVTQFIFLCPFNFFLEAMFSSSVGVTVRQAIT